MTTFIDPTKLTVKERDILFKLQYEIMTAQRDEAHARMKHWENEEERSQQRHKGYEEDREQELKMQDLYEHQQRERLRPSMFLYVDVYFDADRAVWVAEHSGIEAFGSTPEAACGEFDVLWVRGYQEES